MQQLWLDDLEVVGQDKETRQILLRMAALSRSGRTSTFLREVERDDDLDDKTKREVVELAENEPFLQAVEAYFRPGYTARRAGD